MDLIDALRAFVAANDNGSLADSAIRKRIEGGIYDAIFDGLAEAFDQRIYTETDERFMQVEKRLEELDPQQQP